MLKRKRVKTYEKSQNIMKKDSRFRLEEYWALPQKNLFFLYFSWKNITKSKTTSVYYEVNALVVQRTTFECVKLNLWSFCATNSGKTTD